MADNYIAIPCDLDKPATRRRKTPFKTRRSDEATNRSSESAKIVERRFYGGNDGARAVSADFYVARVYARVATSLKRKIVAVNSRNSDRRRGKRAISRITRGKIAEEPRPHTLSFLIHRTRTNRGGKQTFSYANQFVSERGTVRKRHDVINAYLRSEFQAFSHHAF